MDEKKKCQEYCHVETAFSSFLLPHLPFDECSLSHTRDKSYEAHTRISHLSHSITPSRSVLYKFYIIFTRHKLARQASRERDEKKTWLRASESMKRKSTAKR